MDELLINEMIDYLSGDAKRIQHFIKVYAFALLIGKGEGLDVETMNVLRTAAIVHDIGIKNSELKYNSSAGKYQEIEGPAPAREMLGRLGYSDDVIDRVCFLIAHHHTYSNIDAADYQILVEADFLVNMYEDGVGESGVKSALGKVFRTESGRSLCRRIFSI